MTLEEKVDKLLEYQQKAHFWGRVKAIISLILFIIFIVIPVVWSIYFIRNLLAGINVEAIKGTIDNLQAPLNIEMLKNFLK